MIANGTYSVFVNLNDWYTSLESQATATYADAIQYVAQKLKEVLPESEYCTVAAQDVTTATSYPAIKLPWNDGTIGTYNPIIIFPVSTTNLLSSTASSTFMKPPQIGLSTAAGYVASGLGYYRYLNGSTKGADNTWYSGSVNIKDYAVAFRIVKHDSFYRVGCYGAKYSSGYIGTNSETFENNVTLGMPLFIGSCVKRETGESLNSVMTIPPVGSNANVTAGWYNLYLYDDEKVISRGKGVSGYGNMPDTAVELHELTFNEYKMDGFYYSYPDTFDMLKDIIDYTKNPNPKGDEINHNALVVDGKNFSFFKKSAQYSCLCYEENANG